MWRMSLVVVVCLIALPVLWFACDYAIREVPYFERVRLRSENKIDISWLYGIPGSYDVILKAPPGQKFTQEEAEATAKEFQLQFGGNISFINKWGPNFGIEGISEDSAYEIASDPRVQAVLSRLNDSAPRNYY